MHPLCIIIYNAYLHPLCIIIYNAHLHPNKYIQGYHYQLVWFMHFRAAPLLQESSLYFCTPRIFYALLHPYNHLCISATPRIFYALLHPLEFLMHYALLKVLCTFAPLRCTKGYRSAVKISVFINVRSINFQYQGGAKLPWKQARGVRICISAKCWR